MTIRRGRPFGLFVTRAAMATHGARAVLGVPRAGSFSRLRLAEAARQGGRRWVSGVAATRHFRGQVLRTASAETPLRRRRATAGGRGGLDGLVGFPMQPSRGLTSGVVSTRDGIDAARCAPLALIAGGKNAFPEGCKSLRDYCIGSSFSDWHGMPCRRACRLGAVCISGLRVKKQAISLGRYGLG